MNQILLQIALSLEVFVFGMLVGFILTERYLVSPLKRKLTDAKMSQIKGLVNQLGTLGQFMGGIEIDVANGSVRHISPAEAAAAMNTSSVVSPIQMKKKEKDDEKT